MTRPCSASRSCSGGALMRGWARAASLAGSVSPAIRASIILRPVGPMMSEISESSLMLASSSVFCSLWTWLLFSRTSCLRVRSRPQHLRLGIWHEAAADQAMGQEIGQPGRIIDVGFAARHVLDVPGVRQHQLKISVTEDMPDWLPVDARGLHGNMGALFRGQPVRQDQETFGGRIEGSYFPFDSVSYRGPHARRHRLLMHV